jgi:hypothetical protein
MNTPEVTIGFCPRERFSTGPRTLARILESTGVPYRLLVIDCDTPRPVWREMERLLQQHDDVTVIRENRFLLPSASKNLIVDRTDTPYMCLIENDILVESGWVERFLRAARTHSADVVIPLIYELFEDYPERPPRPHYDDDLGQVRARQTSEGERYIIEPRTTSRFSDPASPARAEEFMEAHCLFFRRALFDRMKPFDGECNASDEVDISMAVRDAGGTAIFDPSCSVTFLQPAFPIAPVDRDYFLLRWDPSAARKSHRRLMDRWKLAASPQMLGFWHERHARGGGTLRDWGDQLRALAAGRPIILVDGEQFRGSQLTEDLEIIPFTENGGAYWGDPADDDTAIAELEKDIAAGAGLIVLTWNRFWYLSFYPAFIALLRHRFPNVVNDERMIAFALSAPQDQLDG